MAQRDVVTGILDESPLPTKSDSKTMSTSLVALGVA